jgi:SIR2-like domain
MIDPSLSLAISMQSAPGLYVLLLGSGVSRSSGVPTGWEVMERLIHSVAICKRESCEPDPVAWYRNTFGKEPTYSEVLSEVAKSPPERMQVLRSFFEPTEDERRDGMKMPTPAHRAIAELIVKKYIRIVVTTNFDKLLETALADSGVSPAVIATEDTAHGAMPLAHSPCTIIKINGDYLDPRLKNTTDELSAYEPATERLLDQILDEYGLIVCGWSGDSDIALRSALKRCPTRRFSTYWASRGKLGQHAQDLITDRQAAVVTITDADQFFRDLLDNVQALEDITLVDVVPPKVAVARMKRYLCDASQQINLYDLLTKETEKAHAILTGPQFRIVALSVEGIRRRVSAYEAAIQTVLQLLICGAFWSGREQDSLLLGCFKRIVDQQKPLSPPEADLQRYPALFLLHGIGVAACAAQNYRFLRLLFDLEVRFVAYQENSVAVGVREEYVMDRCAQPQVFGGKYMCEHLFEALREPLREFLPSDYNYDQTFDWFEYLGCLCHCDAIVTRPILADKKARDAKFMLGASVGRFGLHNRFARKNSVVVETELRANELLPEKVAALLQAGFFEAGGGMQYDKFQDVKAAFDRYLLINDWL